ncbi:MAG: tagaturonate epimerase family protein [Candidatus Limnocylindrales bacterium]|jgi:hypothetical protein
MPAGESTDMRLKLDVLGIDPARNPAVIDTGTWDPAAAVAAIARSSVEDLIDLGLAAQDCRPLPAIGYLTPYPGSVVSKDGATFVMVGLADGQYVLLEFRPTGQDTQLIAPLHDGQIGHLAVAVHATDASTLHRYLRDIAPAKGPRAIGTTPRLGIGVRMTTACWPAVFRAMETHGFAANAIQNSVRELNFMSDLLEGRPADRNYASGFGTIEAGYTGSSFEGLWTWGVLEALKHPGCVVFGADADHMQVKRSADGMARARRYLNSCRYYTFFTMDMADILDYGSLRDPSDRAASERARALLGGERVHRELVAFHRRPWRVGRREYQLSEPLVDRMIGKYWRAFDALAELDTHLRDLRSGEPYDLEFTIDEHPPEVAAFDCLTSDEECLFVVNELGRRELPVTHLAPNAGTEKGFDYRGADGLPGLERRLASLTEITSSHGILVDIHSADDLTAPTRAAIRRGTGGRLHYKISPMLQIVFAGTLEEIHPDLFREWWEDAVAYAREEAAAGSPFAARCLDELRSKADGSASHRDSVFHHYGFRFVGRRNRKGRFINRERFYSLSAEFYRVHEERLTAYLGGLADELLT